MAPIRVMRDFDPPAPDQPIAARQLSISTRQQMLYLFT